MESLTDYCTPGATYEEEMVAVVPNVSLRLITFMPPKKTDNPAVIFIAGWISLIRGWKEVLLEMTRDHIVYYIETREKISSKITGKVGYSVEDISEEISSLVSHLKLKDQSYVLFGSSLGGTVILDACRVLKTDPLCLVLIGPDAVFRVPRFGMVIIYLFFPPFYFILRPFIKWYLKTFRLQTDADYAQYEKYCRALDAADPWKLKKAALAFSKYEIWDLLGDIEYPTLIIGASTDTLHEPENLKKMTAMMKRATYLDMGTNKQTHSIKMVEEMRDFIRSIK